MEIWGSSGPLQQAYGVKKLFIVTLNHLFPLLPHFVDICIDGIEATKGESVGALAQISQWYQSSCISSHCILRATHMQEKNGKKASCT